MDNHIKSPNVGRKPFQPTDEQRRQVLTMTGFGILQEEIATSLDIDRKTLTKYFRREIDTGMIEANVRVAQALYTNATKNMNVTAQIWWTKCRMGWKGADVIEASGGASHLALHMLAAQIVSEEIIARQAQPQTTTPDETTKIATQQRLLDAPKPTE